MGGWSKEDRWGGFTKVSDAVLFSEGGQNKAREAHKALDVDKSAAMLVLV